MKTKLFLLSFIIVTLVAACTDSDKVESLNVSADTIRVSNTSITQSIKIESNSEWIIAGNTPWCSFNENKGDKDNTLTLTINNNEGKIRMNKLLICCPTISREIVVIQQAAPAYHHYELPIIFHILQGPGEEKIEKGWLAEVVAACNKLYKGGTSSPDINIELVLPTKDPQENDLEEAGVHYISWGSTETDPNKFTSQTNPDPTGVANLWNMNEYINVFIYNFTDNEKATTGMSYLPYSISSDPLSGLRTGDVYINQSKTPYVHAISLNKEYIYDRTTNNIYTSSDITVTLAHELGHYLGLYHVFSESGCSNDDYCTDTPVYDRANYTSWVKALIKEYEEKGKKPTFKELCQRNSCDGEVFEAHNILDYYYCYSDQFTKEQNQRMRHVLEFSPLIPGPKTRTTQTRIVEDLTIPEGIIMK